jgi:hypothetical protein
VDRSEPLADRGIVELLAVYDADGGLVGEARYVIGHLLGTAHCSLCDITHSPLRRKPAWDAMVRRLGTPLRVVHRNERTAAESAACTAGTPTVLGGTADGRWCVLLTPADLELAGSVEAFEHRLRHRLAQPVPCGA